MMTQEVKPVDKPVDSQASVYMNRKFYSVFAASYLLHKSFYTREIYGDNEYPMPPEFT
jgi:hypothetical protein